jgi:diguanylate cyclase (GGDEF)-like protein
MAESTEGGVAAAVREVFRALAALPGRRRFIKFGINEAFLAQGAIAMLGYGIFFAVYDAAGLAPLIGEAALAFGSYLLGIFLSIRGSANAAGVISLITPLHVVLTFAWAFSWEAGTHLMLLAGASAVFAALAPEWRSIRTAVVVANVATFAAIQALSTPAAAWYVLPPHVLRALFTINAVAAATLLYIFAGVVQARAERAQQLATLALKHAGDLAETDALTGLANRRPALVQLDELARPGRRKYCIALLDFDHFKQLNDEYGHSCGDQVLSAVGHELNRAVRQADTIARWGGEEFLVLLPDTGIEDATRLMERVRRSVDEMRIFCGQHHHHVTVSIGVIEGTGDGRSQEAIKRADAALYQAKAAGRNQVRAVVVPPFTLGLVASDPE